MRRLIVLLALVLVLSGCRFHRIDTIGQYTSVVTISVFTVPLLDINGQVILKCDPVFVHLALWGTQLNSTPHFELGDCRELK